MNSSDKTSTLSDLRWLFERVRPHLSWQLASVVVITIGSLASLLDALVMKWLLDVVLPARNLTALSVAGVLIFLTYGGRATVSNLGTKLSFHANQKTLLDLRTRLLHHMSLLSADYHESTPVGARMYVLRDAVDELGRLGSDLFPLLLRTTVLIICLLVTMFILNARLSLMIAPLIPAFFFTVRFFRRRLQVTSDAVQAEASRSSSFMQEHLSNLIQIQLLTRERLQARRALRGWADLIRAEYRRKNADIIFSISASLVIVTGMAAVLGYGGLQVLRGTLSVGGLVAFYSYILRLFDSLYYGVDVNCRFQRVGSTTRLIRSTLELRASVIDSPDARPLPQLAKAGSVRMQNVSFAYRRGVAAIHELSLSIHPGERVALVGPSGSGKSTIAKLITRLYDAGSGLILVNGSDIRDVRLASLRAAVRYIPQRAVLFDGTLEENLRYGDPDATTRQLQEAAEIAELTPVIERCPLGWCEPLGPCGGFLSGGERQRVAIARAILQRPRILILDEATCETDSSTEQLILEQLDRRLPTTTLLFISHRLSTLKWVDRILVLHEGRLVDAGDHESLYLRCRLYARLYNQSPEEASEKKGSLLIGG